MTTREQDRREIVGRFKLSDTTVVYDVSAESVSTVQAPVHRRDLQRQQRRRTRVVDQAGGRATHVQDGRWPRQPGSHDAGYTGVPTTVIALELPPLVRDA